MKEKIETIVERASNFIDGQSALRIMVKADDGIVRSKFLERFFDRVEAADLSYDTLRLNPEGETIKIETTRQIKDFLSYPPTFARRRYIISDEIAKATPEAVAALLKITEEPPEFAAFIFFTVNPSSVISTIRSRFVTINLSVSTESIVDPGVLEGIDDPILKSVVRSLPTAAVYHEKNPDVLGSFIKKLKGSLTGADAFIGAVKDGLPDFAASLAAEEILLSIKKNEIPLVFKKFRNLLNSDKSRRISKVFADAALVIAEDLMVFKKTSYWKGITRKPYIPRYVGMKPPKRAFVERLIKIRSSNANEDVSIFLILSEFAMLKGV